VNLPMERGDEETSELFMPQHLIAAELQGLHGDARMIWTDRVTRHRVLRNLALPATSGMYGGSALRIDEAVAKGMRVLGLPRGRTRGFRIISLGNGVRGRKTPDRWIEISENHVAEMLEPRWTPDGIFKSWVHESLHARRPYAAPELQHTEYPAFAGYEEGLVEGLTRWIVQDQAGMAYVPAYESYVRAYEVLSFVLGISVEALWRLLWRYRFGTVRAAFPREASRIWYNLTGRWAAEERLQNAADATFAFHGRMPPCSEADLTAHWKEAFDDERSVS